MASYLMRFDDITPSMNWRRFKEFKNFISKFGIRSILGVIPENLDKTLNVSSAWPKFIENLNQYKSYGDVISQHGLSHIYETKKYGFFGSGPKSEFAGLTLEEQIIKLNKGKEILLEMNLWEPYFMAPAHSFDKNTLLALKSTNFKYVLDGYALYPYKNKNLVFIPQIYSMPLPKYLPCISQLCLHMNSISENKIKYLKSFIEKNYTLFIDPRDIDGLTNKLSFLNPLSFILLRSYKRFV